MKLTKGRFVKLININKQTRKNNNTNKKHILKHNITNKQSNNKKHINLRANTLKHIK